MVDWIWRDLRDTVRRLRRERAYTAAMITSMGLALGLNALILSVFQHVLLRPLPYLRPSELVILYALSQRTPDPRLPATASTALAWRDRTDLFSSVAIFESDVSTRFDYVAADSAVGLKGAFVTPEFFDVLGVRPLHGRAFAAADDSPSTSAVILSHHVWRRVFGEDERMIGRPIDLVFEIDNDRRSRKRRSVIVIGVLPERFVFSYDAPTDIWAVLPRSQLELESHASNSPVSYRAVARLKPGVSSLQARTELAGANTNAAMPSMVEPLHDVSVGAAGPVLALAAATAALLLVIGYLNVALLTLDRARRRQPEMALRAAVGASPTQLARHVLYEAVVLSATAAAVAFALAVSAGPALRAILPGSMPRIDDMAPAPVAWRFALPASAVFVVIGALAGIRGISGSSLPGQAAESLPTATNSRRGALEARLLITAQVAVVTVLLVGSGLLIESLFRLVRLDPGFDGSRVTLALIHVRQEVSDAVDRRAPLRALAARLREAAAGLPGVTAASVVSHAPLTRTGSGRWQVHQPNRKDVAMVVDYRAVDEHFFSLMNVRQLAGRVFDAGDRDGSPPVIVVSELLAQRFFAGENPVGAVLTAHADAKIVGVVADVRYQALDTAPRPTVYVPFQQYPVETVALLARRHSATPDVGPALREAVAIVAPEQPVDRVTTMRELMSESVAERHLLLTVISAFAATGLCLAAAGVFGVASRAVSERTREWAIRAAIGASPSRLVRLTLWHVLGPVVTGLGLGLLAAWWLERALKAYLFEVVAGGALGYLGAAMLVLAVSLWICSGAAVQVLKIGRAPVTTLRDH